MLAIYGRIVRKVAASATASGSPDEKCLEQGEKIAIGRPLHKGGAPVRQVTPSELWGFTNSLMRCSESGRRRHRPNVSRSPLWLDLDWLESGIKLVYMLREAVSDVIVQQQHRYNAVAQRIEQQIRDGEISAGSRILGERELAKVLGVSRVTLRRALSELRDRGVLVSDEAKGWFVAPPNVSEQNVLRSFSEMAASRGLSSSSQIIQSIVRIASFEETEILRLEAGSQVFQLERVRILAGEAVGIEESLVPLQRAPNLPELDFVSQSLYVSMREAGAGPAIADYVLSATSATAQQAKLLHVPEGTALLATNAIARDVNGVPVELSKTFFRGDRYRFLTTLKAELR